MPDIAYLHGIRLPQKPALRMVLPTIIIPGGGHIGVTFNVLTVCFYITVLLTETVLTENLSQDWSGSGWDICHSVIWAGSSGAIP